MESALLFAGAALAFYLVFKFLVGIVRTVFSVAILIAVVLAAFYFLGL